MRTRGILAATAAATLVPAAIRFYPGVGTFAHAGAMGIVKKRMGSADR